MKESFTFQEILKLNGGRVQDANEIIRIFQSQKLMSSISASGNYHIGNLKSKDLILKTRMERILAFVQSFDSPLKILVTWFGWVLFIGTQLFNLFDWLKLHFY